MHAENQSYLDLLSLVKRQNDRIQELERRIEAHETNQFNDRQKLVNIIAGSNLGTWEWNVKTGETVFNERWAEMIGYKLNELGTLTIDTWKRFVHPDDLPNANLELSHHFSGEKPFYDAIFRMKHKDGHWIWVNDRGKVMAWDVRGEPLWMYGTHTDISSRISLENRLQQLLEIEKQARDVAAKELDNQTILTNLLFEQPMTGVFFMMLDEPILWNDHQDKEALLDYAFKHHRITRVNKAMLDQYKAKEEDLIGATPNDMFEHDLQHGREVWRKFFDEGHLHIETNEQRFDGSRMSVLGDYICIYDSDGRIVGHFGIQSDVTDKVKAEEEVKEYKTVLDHTTDRYQMIVENIGDVVWVINPEQFRFTYLSPSVEQLTGYSVEEVMSMSPTTLYPSGSGGITIQNIKLMAKTFSDQAELASPSYRTGHLTRKNGEDIWYEISYKLRRNLQNEIEMVGVARDITVRKKKEEEILYLSTHDLQTGLMNRAAIRKMLYDADQNNKVIDHLSAVYIDIDNFKLINEILGHEDGDRMIAELAYKIRDFVGSSGTVYRFDSDEFLLLMDLRDQDGLVEICTSIQRLISRQITMENRVLFITLSIGIGIAQQGDSVLKIIRNAEKALFISKKQQNAITIYREEFDRARTRDFILEVDMTKALENGEFELHFQPIFDVREGIFNQAEALLRWNHKTLGRVSPAEFIPIAERTKLIIPITDWVIEQACRKISEWKTLGFDSMIVSVNLSLISFENRGDELVEFIIDTICKSGISPSSLKLEITESTLINDLDEVVRVFKVLKEFGVRLALDDFGTGYSTFGNILDLPLDIIKLDRSLIKDIDTNERSQMILSSMITIIHGLELEVVIEGVETQAQFRHLKLLNCDFIQGFLFSRPLPENEFIKYYFEIKHQGNEPFKIDHNTGEAVSYLIWKSDWNSGHEEIDRQHKRMILLANQIIRYAINEKPKEEILTQVEILVQYTAEHFDYENYLIAKIGESDHQHHADEHAKLLEKVVKLKESYLRGDVRPTAFFVYVVDDFVLGHMIDEDMKLFSRLKELTGYGYREHENALS